MKQNILNYLSRYTTITTELEEAIEKTTLIRAFEKGTVLLKEGSISNECYFVIKGCVRAYFLKDGEEKTTDFYTEEQAVVPQEYGKGIPSRFYLECLEDTVASCGNPQLEKEAFEKYPQLAVLFKTIAEAVMAKAHASFTDFKTSSPEERYVQLLKTRPDLIQRAPQSQIASYLGIKPESLSRIKKRLAKKENGF